MRITNIQNTQQHFNGLKIKGQGIYELAEDFYKNPALEKDFLTRIAAPLQKTKTDVIYNGYSASFKEPQDLYNTPIISAHGDMYITGTSANRNLFRPSKSKLMRYTNDFIGYPYSNIEAAKNIALYKEAERTGKIVTAEATEQNIKPLGETIAEKIKSLTERFGK